MKTQILAKLSGRHVVGGASNKTSCDCTLCESRAPFPWYVSSKFFVKGDYVYAALCLNKHDDVYV